MQLAAANSDTRHIFKKLVSEPILTSVNWENIFMQSADGIKMDFTRIQYSASTGTSGKR